MEKGKGDLFQSCLTFIHKTEDIVLAVLLSLMIILACSQIVLRNFFDAGISWGDPLLRIMVLWLGLLGALAASRENKHINIDVVSAFIPERFVDLMRVITCLFTVFICLIIAWYSLGFLAVDIEDEVKAFSQVPAWWFELIIPISFFLIAIRYFIHSFLYFKEFQKGADK
jgi:TRAP-type C4-dicarboxylate transport system permease small subunit